MRKMLLIALTVFGGVLLPQVARAQMVCEEPNTLAMIFSNQDINATVPLGTYTAELFVLSPTMSCLRGFEVRLIVPEMSVLQSIEFPDGALNIGSGGNMIVGFQTPLTPDNGRIHLATLTFINNSTSQQDFFFAPTEPASIPGSTALLRCDEVIVPSVPISLDYDLPVARLNGLENLVYCTNQGMDGFQVLISCLGDLDNMAGTSSLATAGYDVALDLLDTDPDPVVFFNHPEWSVPGGPRFRYDIHHIYDPHLSLGFWDFTVNAAVPGGESIPFTVPLALSPSFANDPGVFMTLMDQTTGETIPLVSPYVYEYIINQEETRNFRLFVGNEFYNLPGQNLDIAVSATGPDLVDTNNHAGAAAWATDDFDLGIDLPEPPPAPDHYLTASFIHDDWPYGPRFQAMVHGVFYPVVEHRLWPLRVETDQIGTIELDFAPNFAQTDNIPLLLKDLQSGEIIDLFPDLTFSFANNQASIHDFVLIVGPPEIPTLSPTFRYFTQGWHLIGLPMDPAATHESLGEAVLGQYNGGYSYIYRYLGEDGYELEEPSETAVRGRGYWLGLVQPLNWTMPLNIDSAPFTMPLIPGWNLVGNPLWFPGTVDGVRVQHLAKTYTWQEAITEGLVAETVYGFNTSNLNYIEVSDLDAWHGYWISALADDVSLVFDWHNFVSPFGAPTGTQPTGEPLWTMDLTAHAGQGHSYRISLGTHPEASLGYDPRLDAPRAPASPFDSGYLGILRPEMDLPCGNTLVRDLVGPNDQPLVWDLVVNLPQPGSFTLTWDRHDWPTDLDLQLYSPGDNRVLVPSLRHDDSVQISAPQGYLALQVRTAQMSGVEVPPAGDWRLGVRPNPFNPQTTISFNLPRPGSAEVRIYTVRGEWVATLKADGTEPGPRTLLWQGRDRAGREVPSGSYFARLYFQGQARGSVVKMSLVR